MLTFTGKLLRLSLMIVGALALLMIALTIAGATAQAHSWYDPICCLDKDCGPALSGAYRSDGSLELEVTPGHSISVPAGYPVRPSHDNDYHVCIMFNQIRCVYVPANS